MLETLGILFLGLILLVGFFAIRFYLRVKSVVNDAASISTLVDILPPFQCILDESGRENWQGLDELGKNEALLEKSGFENHGYFTSYAGDALIEVALWNHPLKGIVVAFMEASGEDIETTGLISDVFVRFDDDTQLTINNGPDANILPRPEHSPLIHVSSSVLQDLFAALKTHVPPGKKIRPIKRVKTFYQRCFEQYSAWLWQEPQLRSPQVKAIANKVGVDLTDDIIAELREHARVENVDAISQSIVDGFARQTSMSVDKWAKVCDRLVVVHENMGANDVADCFYDLVDDIDENFEATLDALENKGEDFDALALFHTLARDHTVIDTLSRVASVRQPLRAEIYLAPSV